MLPADADALLARVQATDANYTEPALSFMLPPRLDDLSALRGAARRIVMYHGTSDPIFSSEHSVQVYEAWSRGSGAPAESFARLYLVPGMNHCRGGPSTDQFDLLQPLVEWVEQGKAPGRVDRAGPRPRQPRRRQRRCAGVVVAEPQPAALPLSGGRAVRRRRPRIGRRLLLPLTLERRASPWPAPPAAAGFHP